MGQDNYRTPDYVFNYYDKQYKFQCDVAASASDCKCGVYFSKKDNGLIQPWYKSNFCNPPYSTGNGNRLIYWVRKAWEESGNGKTSVLIFPLSFTSYWFRDYVKDKARVEIPDERICFINPETGKPDNQPRNDNMIIIYGPGIMPGIVSVHIPKPEAKR
jgi:phage N-6-adenine-methyltransferase